MIEWRCAWAGDGERKVTNTSNVDGNNEEDAHGEIPSKTNKKRLVERCLAAGHEAKGSKKVRGWVATRWRDGGTERDMDKLPQTENHRDGKKCKINKEEPPCMRYGCSVVCCF